MLTIGEFSRISFATKKTLRYYDEIGLVRPEYIAENGYRYYTVNQLGDMLLISKLKGYGFSLPEIAVVLTSRDMDALQVKLLEKQELIMQQLDQTRHVLDLLEQDVEKLRRREDIMDQKILVKTVERTQETIYGVRRKISVEALQEMFGTLFQEIAQKKLMPTGAPMAFYHDEDFDRDNSDIEVAVPIAEAVEGCRTLPGGLHCVTTVVGPYGDALYTPAYAGVMKWVEENGFRIAGAPFDVYVRGGGECPPEENVTEIYFPIAKA